MQDVLVVEVELHLAVVIEVTHQVQVRDVVVFQVCLAQSQRLLQAVALILAHHTHCSLISITRQELRTVISKDGTEEVVVIVVIVLHLVADLMLLCLEVEIIAVHLAVDPTQTHIHTERQTQIRDMEFQKHQIPATISEHTQI